MSSILGRPKPVWGSDNIVTIRVSIVPGSIRLAQWRVPVDYCNSIVQVNQVNLSESSGLRACNYRLRNLRNGNGIIRLARSHSILLHPPDGNVDPVLTEKWFACEYQCRDAPMASSFERLLIASNLII